MADESNQNPTNPENPTIPAPTVGVGTGFPATTTRATEPAVATDYGAYLALTMSLVLGQPWDENERWFGTPKLYRRMRRCPPIDGALRTLKHAVLAHGIQVLPRVKGKPHAKPGDDPEADLSQRVARSFEQALRGMEIPAEARSYEMMDAMWQRCKLADIVWRVDEDDETGDPRLVLDSLDPKQREVWDFVVDPYLKVIGVLVAGPAAPNWRIVSPEKVAILAWDTCDGDPRGNTILEPLFGLWTTWQQTWKQWFNFGRMAAGERLLGTLGDKDAVSGPPLDANGQPTTGPDVSPEDNFNRKLRQFLTATSMVVGPNDKVELLEPASEGGAFEKIINTCRREMVSTILLQARATMEAEHGSKADSASGADILGNLIRSLRSWVGLMWCRIAYLQTLYNHGPEVARKHAPDVTLGEVDHQDVNAALTALAKCGYKLTPSQMAEIDSMLGLPVREPDEEMVADPAGKGNDPASDDGGQDEKSAKNSVGDVAKSGSQGKGKDKGKKSDSNDDEE